MSLVEMIRLEISWLEVGWFWYGMRLPPLEAQILRRMFGECSNSKDLNIRRTLNERSANIDLKCSPNVL